MMWKTVVAGTTVLALAGASFAYAEHGPGRFDHARHWHMSAADIGAFADARIAALHAGLELNADQEKNWPAVESALKEMAKQRVARIDARRTETAPTDPVQRLNRLADNLSQRGAALKKLADAVGPLYNSLDQAQKHRFTVLSRLERPRMAAWRMRHRWHDHDGGRPPGMGAPQPMGPPPMGPQPQ
jgi:zinc resistance-associated protein